MTLQNIDNHTVQATTHRQRMSRRGVLAGGAMAGLASAFGFSAIAAQAGQRPSAGQMGPSGPASMTNQPSDDAMILNTALFYEHQAIWAYGFAATRLSDTDVGRAVKALALRNQADHMAHRDALAAAVRSLGAMPVQTKDRYDLSAYINAGEGNIDSDVNIAKLALALETDAAIAYTKEIAKLKNPALITAGASIGSNEAAHATAIRAAFVALGVNIPYVPGSFISADTRSSWVLKV
jgi:rubrerythrin